MKQPAKNPLSIVERTPESAFAAIDATSEEVGGGWLPAEEDKGAIGRTMFDLPSSQDGTITVLLPKESIDQISSQSLVRIESRTDKRTYLGAIIAGPFAEPDGLRADSTPMVVSTVQGGLLMPRFHGRAQIELLGERLEDGSVIPPRRRPKPNSPVFSLGPEESATVLRSQGNVRLGLADGYDDLAVSVPGNSKAVFPRHLGVLGTTGGGKSTTVSGLIAKAQELGMATVLIDTEGEYCAIHEATQDPKMIQSLGRRGLKPKGVKGTRIYHLQGRETAYPKHPDKVEFSLKFSNLSPYAVQEILGLSDAQSERFFKAYDITKLAIERLKIWPKTEAEKTESLDLDELETGYPTMTLAQLVDVVRLVGDWADKDKDEGSAGTWIEDQYFRKSIGQIVGIINEAKPPKNVISWRALLGKLGKIKRLRVFDTNAPALDYGAMLAPGRVAILDLNDTDSPQINNLVIAELLRGIQSQQEVNYQDAIKKDKEPTPVLVFIEEAHEFLSAQRIRQMEVLFQQVARIARRGRKRWLGLVFITQLPQHLPDEVLGLINNWILHKIGDAGIVRRLRASIGGIHEGLWNQLPSLAAGQAVVSFTSLARPILTNIDPTPCRLLMVE